MAITMMTTMMLTMVAIMITVQTISHYVDDDAYDVIIITMLINITTIIDIINYSKNHKKRLSTFVAVVVVTCFSVQCLHRCIYQVLFLFDS